MNDDDTHDEPAATAFRCPVCPRKKLHVYKSEAAANGLMVRYRRCRQCGHAILTREYPVKVVQPGRAADEPAPGCASAPLSGAFPA